MHGKRIFYVVNSDWFFLSHRLPLALKALELGFEVFVLTNNTGRRTEIESHGIHFIQIDFERSGKNPFKDFKLILALKKVYKLYQPQIVHHVTLKPALYGTIAARLLKRDAPIIVNAVTGLGYLFSQRKKSFVRVLVQWLIQYAYNQSEIRFIFQNPDDLKLYQTLGLLQSGNYRLIKGSGVDIEKYKYTQPIPKQKVCILFPARMLLDKGLMELIEAAHNLHKQYEAQLFFKLVGGIDLHNPSGITEAQLLPLLIPGYLEWHGYHANMLEQYTEADIVCLPSYGEGLPKSLVEAMAIGRPIITTNAPGCKECVVHTVNGLAVAIGSVTELEQAIITVAGSAEMRIEMGKQSRYMMEQEMALNIIVEQTFGCYTPLVSPTTQLPTISIITVVLDNYKLLKDAIESVLMQTYPHIEYIIIDGASTDGSLQLIQSYGNRIHTVISEPDGGIYDAMNKGLAMAKGDIVGFLNSDDFYAHNQVIEQVAASFMAHPNRDAVYGDLDYVSLTNRQKIVRKWRSGAYKRSKFLAGWMPPHPTFFMKTDLYRKHGGYNQYLQLAADYELMLRYALKHGIAIGYIKDVLVKMRLGGQSNRSITNRIKANIEDIKAWKLNNLKTYWYTLLLKPFRKIFQYRFQ
jgi:glycosyltransferase involved in cell wall biosynthesis/GT2 family glycosyltransferase